MIQIMFMNYGIIRAWMVPIPEKSKRDYQNHPSLYDCNSVHEYRYLPSLDDSDYVYEYRIHPSLNNSDSKQDHRCCPSWDDFDSKHNCQHRYSLEDTYSDDTVLALCLWLLGFLLRVNGSGRPLSRNIILIMLEEV
jgi:hypothetical protein